MTAVSRSQLALSAEAREAIRPLAVVLNNKSFPVKDISSGGINIENVEGDYTVGKKLPLIVQLQSEALSLDVALQAEVQHYNRIQRSLGCRFINLTTEHIALLNQILKSLVTNANPPKGFAGVVSNDRGVKETMQPAVQMTPRQMMGLSLAALFGLAALSFIGYNVYKGIFIVEAPSALVSGPVIELRAFSDGILTNTIPPDTLMVETGQTLATLTPPSGTTGQGSLSLVSPCDCRIYESFKDTGDYVQSGDDVVSLVPLEAKPWIIAELDPAQAAAIEFKTETSITVAGSDMEYVGRIASIKTVSTPASTMQSATGYTKIVQIKILPKQSLPAEFIGRPANVSFRTH